MAESKAHFHTAADVLAGWKDGVLTGKPPVFYPIGAGELARLEVGPGLVTLIGGAPGAGSAWMQQTVMIIRQTIEHVANQVPASLEADSKRLSQVEKEINNLVGLLADGSFDSQDPASQAMIPHSSTRILRPSKRRPSR